MRDPVLCADGNSYERAAVTAWLLQHDTSPVNGSPLAHRDLIPNHVLRSVMPSVAPLPA